MDVVHKPDPEHADEVNIVAGNNNPLWLLLNQQFCCFTFVIIRLILFWGDLKDTHFWFYVSSEILNFLINSFLLISIPPSQASPGGGFGPVSDQGYGVSYMIPEDTHFWFHVSSKISCETTNSERFMDRLFMALGDMRKLFLEKS